jgi:SAM-dependent methyltransferase
MSPHAATIFLSAFLLFLVQPVIAKQILPWFGGSAAVWATCLVFFQSVLLAGYAYADYVTRKLSPRRQLIVHGVMLTISLAWLPIAPGDRWKPTGGEDPMLLILGLLIATIGLPYLMLSTTSPLVQAWYWRRYQTRVPYRLFALSNFASLLALLAYPALIEPWIPNRGQTFGWSGLYVLFVISCMATAYFSLRPAATTTAAASEAPPPDESSDADQAPPSRKQLLTWLTLSATGSCLLLAITNHITQNIAAVPFLWVLPLSLYLISFVLAFDHPRWYVRPLFLLLLAMALPLMGWAVDSHGLILAVALYAGGLFVGCMFAHGELALTKPAPKHLTTFYLMMSVGGALGSVLIGILAPLLLPGYYELGIILVLLAILLVVRVWPMHLIVRVLALGIAVATSLTVASAMQRYTTNTRVMVRNFYGVIRTRHFDEPAPYRSMYHGGIKHGGQLWDADARRLPSSYFGPTSGYGRLFASLPDAGPRKVGVIGLGAGALAVYGREGDSMVFYELDPEVVDVARAEFTFLSDMPGTIEIVVGDGRLSLEREAPRGYDVLAIDAFSGDSIPMHLLTREAMAVYKRHLAPGGAIVFQATNRYIDIVPVVQKLAAELGMESVLVSDFPGAETGREYWLATTDQVIVTSNQAILSAPAVRSGGERVEPSPDAPVFTDDYSNLLRILK